MRGAVIGITCGLLAATAIAAPLLPSDTVPDLVHAPASEAVPALAAAGRQAFQQVSGIGAQEDPIDFDKLIRIDDDYMLKKRAGFSDEVRAHAIVHKIGYGRREEVNIVTTASGTYSSDGLMSRHVRYPHVEAERQAFDGLSASIWSRQHGWSANMFSTANSVVTFGRIDGGGVFISGNSSTCLVGKGFATCN